MKLNNLLKFVVAVLISELAGVIGSFFTIPAISTWYANLVKPAFSPPNWVFGPVWITLYFIMGVSAFLIWRTGLEQKGVKKALIIFDFQLALNVLWSAIFFGLHNPLAAFLNIIALWIAIIWTAFGFYKISKPAALLFIPYLLWVLFAAYLNYSIWILN